MEITLHTSHARLITALRSQSWTPEIKLLTKEDLLSFSLLCPAPDSFSAQYKERILSEELILTLLREIGTD